MRKFLILTVCLFCGAALALGELVPRTLALLSATGGNATATGAITFATSTSELKLRSFVCRATAANVSGSSPTLDLKIQTCRDTTTASCVDLCVWPRCTTGSCWGDGAEQYASMYDEAVYPYFRAIATFGGSSPVYTYAISLDY